MGWTEFLVALGLFFLSHAVPARPAIRARLVASLGRTGFLLAYSLVSLALLGWLIGAAARAPFVPLWPWSPWETWIPNLAMPIVCLLAALAVGAPNPLSFGGAHAERFDPDRPGVAGVARHPILWALAIWAVAHLFPNGDLAHGLLFGLFATFALGGMAVLDRRRRRDLGEAEWRRLTRAAPAWPLASGLPRFDLNTALLIRLLAAVAAYGALLSLHPMVIGVSPLPAGP